VSAEHTRWLTPSQAARELGVTPARVRQLISTGQLPHNWTPLGRLVPAASVAALAAERLARRADAEGER
jgi:hypothetical protein